MPNIRNYQPIFDLTGSFYFEEVGGVMTFTINNHIWQLKFVKPSSRNLLRSDVTWTFGVTDNNVKTVFLLENMSDYMTDKVLVHELTHVHAMEYDYYMPIEVEEIVCDFLSLYGRSVIYMADEIMGNILRRIA